MLTFERYFLCGEHRIGLLHGHHHAGKSRDRSQYGCYHARAGGLVVCGHSHQPKIEERDGLWMINRLADAAALGPASNVGTLDVGEQVRAQLIDL